MERKHSKWVCYCRESRKRRVKHERKYLPDLNYPPPPEESESSPHNHDKKRVKYERKFLPDLNYPPPPEELESSSSSFPHNYLKLPEISHEPTAAASAYSSKKLKMRESGSNFHWFKACCNMIINYIMSIFNKNNKKKDD
ncbi:uncharacterized protein LOC106754945 [Vigna radiata var. radiata]|uniref:Uncharacterized protein LOC106754945 n=1 Tax=Vigna radiata var. radiata TaxID=3916 RepID=A0A3Q0EPQ7_VIGRR|nr:uncharacterized protein LOC106754945 [Vigna radiata var. radiata]